jgi:hypothetical protein
LEARQLEGNSISQLVSHVLINSGRLIAIMLGRLGLTIDDAIAAYTSIAPRMFAMTYPKFDNYKDVKIRLKAITEAKQYWFDANNLEQSVKEMLIKCNVSENEPFQQRVAPKCRV